MSAKCPICACPIGKFQLRCPLCRSWIWKFPLVATIILSSALLILCLFVVIELLPVFGPKGSQFKPVWRR